MTKINTNKLVALLAALCLMTSAFVGSTLAKYTTSASGSDTARVAKFGVVLEVGNAEGKSGFKTLYTKDDDAYSGTLSVEADGTSSEQKLVAPGTQSDAPITFKISGTPEVATKVDIEMTNVKDIQLPAKTGYIDYTQTADDGSYSKTFDLETDYYPVKFTLKQTEGVLNGATDITFPVTLVNKGTLNDVANKLAVFSGATYAPNTKLDATFELTWEWAFDNTATVEVADKADTYLGNVIAGSPSDINAEGVVTDLSYDIKFTVTQVD